MGRLRAPLFSKELILADEKRYVIKSLDELRKTYKGVSVYVRGTSDKCAIGSGSRVLFWVASDGYRTLVYQTTGYLEILKNKDFKVLSVLNSPNTEVLDGRIKYINERGDWDDLGPYTPSGYNPDYDPDFDTIRRSLTATGSGDIITEEFRNAKRAGEIKDIFSDGSSFMDDGW